MKQTIRRPALFLDRDGVINYDVGYISKSENFKFNPDIFEVIQLAIRNNFHIVVITNQSGIGRGIIDIEQYHKINNWMVDELEKNSCKIDLVLTSSLDPTRKNIGKFEMLRRKPNPGLIFDAEEILNLNLEKSILVGDNLSDIEAGINAGIKNLFLINKKIHFPSVISLSNIIDLLNNSNFLVSLAYGNFEKNFQ